MSQGQHVGTMLRVGTSTLHLSAMVTGPKKHGELHVPLSLKVEQPAQFGTLRLQRPQALSTGASKREEESLVGRAIHFEAIYNCCQSVQDFGYFRNLDFFACFVRLMGLDASRS